MTRTYPAKRSLPWWHLGLQLLTLLSALLIIAFTIQFARNEWIAVQSLREFFNQQSDKVPSVISAKSLGSDSERQSAELQGRIADEARSPYLQAQIHNLLLVASDEPEDLWWKQQAKEQGERGDFVGWETNPEMLTRFLEEQKSLFAMIHRWCDDDTPAVFPPNYELGLVSRLLFLECAAAIRRSDAEQVPQSIRSLGHLTAKFDSHAITYRNDQFSQSIYCAAIHRALDKQLLPRSEWESIQGQLRKSLNDYEEYKLFQRNQHVATIKKDFDATVDLNSVWSHGLPSIQWRTLNFPLADSYRKDSDGLLPSFALTRRYAQSLILRLAALRFIEATENLPTQESDLDPYGATAIVWTDPIEENTWKYRRTDSGSGIISLSFPPRYSLGAEFWFPTTMVFEQKTQSVPNTEQ